MRAVIQRVRQAKVTVEGKIVGQIEQGLLVFLGIESTDTELDKIWLAEKIPTIRCFEDENGKINTSVRDIDGDIMVISQFTLFGNLRKGTRPSFNRAASPEMAIPMYESFIKDMESAMDRPVARGIFGAMMTIDAENDGPVTLIIDTRNKDF